MILLHLISLAHRGQTTTATETLMDQLDWNVPGFPFSWEAEEWKKTQRRGVHRKLPPIYKHNFVTFLSDDVCLISPAKPLPLHPLDVTCKDNSQKFKKKKNT